MKKILCFVLVIIISVCRLTAQDTQFSQEYSLVQYLNPALVGSGVPHLKGTFHYRLQWPGLEAQSQSYFIGVEESFENINSGVGAYYLSDVYGDGEWRKNTLNLQYAYTVALNEKLALKMGMEGGFIQHRLDQSAMVFPNQFDEFGSNGQASGEQFANTSEMVADIGGGLMLFADNFWFGLAGSHLNQPTTTFIKEGEKYPVKYSAHMGFKIDISETKYNRYDHHKMRRSLFPFLHYKSQGESDQFDMGMYAMYDVFLGGLFYRGIPFKKIDEGIQNNEALVFLVGYNYHHSVHISYSYDAVVSNLAGFAKGAHEINLTLVPLIPVAWFKKQQKSKSKKQLPCPTFMDREWF